MPKPLPQRVWEIIHEAEPSEDELWQLASELRAVNTGMSNLLETLLGVIRVHGVTDATRVQLRNLDKLKNFWDLL